MFINTLVRVESGSTMNPMVTMAREAETNKNASSILVDNTYHELEHRHPHELSVLSEFKHNLELLEDMQFRLSYLIKEVSSVLVKKQY